jgi:hypothetical protein
MSKPEGGRLHIQHLHDEAFGEVLKKNTFSKT